MGGLRKRAPLLFGMKSGGSYYIGIEWVGNHFRAGVFDGRWRLVGKASRSAKTQRGFSEVLNRMARCTLDAIDEADLQPEDIGATAVLTDEFETGQTWGPQQVNQLANCLPAHLSSKLTAAGRIATIMWGVHEHELDGKAQSWLGLFWEPKPRLFAANLGKPQRVDPVSIKSSTACLEEFGLQEMLASPSSFLEVVKFSEAKVMLVIGQEYDDGRSSGVRRLSQLLADSSLNIPVHIPKTGTYVGTWAAAELASKTFTPLVT